MSAKIKVSDHQQILKDRARDIWECEGRPDGKRLAGC
jgi:hypothetical protein